jgi:ketosteroid isomerase-like protein
VTNTTDEITEALVRQCKTSYRQFRENDPAFLDAVDPDVEWHVPDTLPGGGEIRGQLALLEFLDTTSRLWEAHPEPDEFLPAGDRLIVLGTWRGHARSTGTRVAVPFAHVLRYRDGKLVYFRNYLDAAKVLQSLEAPATG